jgi:putative hydrolase of the HAD superfamily
MFDLIAFDADDTLWENNALYLQTTRRFKEILSGYTLTGPVETYLEATESRNLQFFGYGVMSFVLSLIEAAVDLTGGQVSAAHIHELVQWGKQMIAAEVLLYEDAEATLARIAGRYRLILITKGDLLHQQSKVEHSGLGRFFSEVHVVADKTPAIYAAILEKHAVDPQCFLMVGDSMRSDILPVLELGGRAIYVPNDQTWTHERRQPPQGYDGRYFEVERLGLLPALLEEMEKQITKP